MDGNRVGSGQVTLILVMFPITLLYPIFDLNPCQVKVIFFPFPLRKIYNNSFQPRLIKMRPILPSPQEENEGT